MSQSIKSQSLAIHWFRQDLRVNDNFALAAAARHGKISPVYILDDVNAQEWRIGAASRWWLHHSLHALNRSLQGRLWILHGNAAQLLPQFAAEQQASLITWNRCYEPWRVRRDEKLQLELQERGIAVQTDNGSLLFDPGSVIKDDGSPYKVFTPFYRQARARLAQSNVSTQLDKFELQNCSQPEDKIDKLELLPAINWYQDMQDQWQPGETGAQRTLQNFLDSGLPDYQKGRDFPALRNVSGLSPYLHYGEISPRQLVTQVQQQAQVDSCEAASEHFIREIIWREFSYSLLHFFPNLTTRNLKPVFDHFPWSTDGQLLQKWQQGQTGFPLIDAGMRELWQTGYMHNRVRMIVASFLVKNLMIHWNEGARWFWECLVDADLANNSCSWQWVAGSGMDAAPYFRIFNPVTQSLKFDPDGTYIKRFVPELSALPIPFMHDPGSAPRQELDRAGVIFGETYPRAIVDLQETRKHALAMYKTLRAVD